MTLIYEEKISTEVRLIHADCLIHANVFYNIIILKKKQWTQMKTKQLNWDYNNFPHRNARFTKPWTKGI